MAEIKSDSVKIEATASSIQSFLNDANNIEQLMPEDKITKWQSDNNTCSFNIKGLAGIGMKREESSIANQVHFVSHGKNPFDFNLDINITEDGNSCSAQIVFDGNMNFMIMTIAKTPLTNLFNNMSETLVKKFS
ncbi:MAG: hypothetical protein ACKVJP_05315 [Flavobacteriales bacterium]|jgi:carbon monoxide dehydrogenase subunit G|tara:strand:+ start:834 stop:1235 length:402 start_codon:yes stop_codon:yes gene_type:complete